MFNEDFADFVAALRVTNVEFLIVGAHALAAHGIVRSTGDLDGRASGRAKDLEDVRRLEQLVEET